jgi:hypothetical protein
MDMIEKIDKLECVNEKSANMPVKISAAGLHSVDREIKW